MKRNLISVVFVSLLMLLFFSCNGEERRADNPWEEVHSLSWISGRDYKEGELIVKFREGIPYQDMMSAHGRVKARLKKTFSHLPGIHVVRLPEGAGVEDAIRQYISDPGVEYAEPNWIRIPFLTPNDPYFSQQWGLSQIGAPSVWDILTGSSSVVIAVLDTGVDYTHEDLSQNMWVNSLEVRNDGVDNDNNGYIDDFYGIDAIVGTGDPMDYDGHGTHVSGIIGASGNNSTGVSGVNWQIRIMALKFIGPSGGYISDELECIDYIISMKERGENIKAVNASFGTNPGTGYSNAERDAIALLGQKDILFVTASGNESNNNDTRPVYPCSYDLPNIICVAATDIDDNLAYFSNYGLDSVDVGSPGVNIYSTLPSNIYGYSDGTSMATPFVTGVAALIAERYPSYDYTRIKETILSSVDPVSSLSGKVLSGGRLNAYSALSSPGRPIRPTRLNASLGVVNTVNLTWKDNSAIEDGFGVERKEESGPYITITVNIPADSTSYSDSTVSELKNYTYRVYAFNTNGNSPYSNEKTITTPINHPTGLAATALSSSSIDISWYDNSSVEDGYRIERKKGSDPYSVIATVGANVTSFHDTGLSASTTYYYRVRAYKGNTNSSYSNEAYATTQEAPSGGGGGGGGCSIGDRGTNREGAILYLLMPFIPFLIKRLRRYMLILFLFVTLFSGINAFAQDIEGGIVIFHAGSLSKPLLEVERAFTRIHPKVKIYREAAGSLASIRKITELKRHADIIAVSDYELIPQLLSPQYVTQYHIFARNRIVIVYSEGSKYASEFNRDNWYKILTRGDVRIGRADPERDPCGYRTLIMWKLAEDYYRVPGLYEKLLKVCPKENVRPKETDLIALQESGELDYHFNYKSVAVGHNLKYLELPVEIDLSDRRFEKYYARASVTVSGKDPSSTLVRRGSAILYGIAILKDAKNRKVAEEFINFLLGKGGQAIIAETGLTPVK